MPRYLDASVIAELPKEVVKFMYMVDLQLDSGSLAFNGSLSNYQYDSKTFYGAGHLGSVGGVKEGVDLDPASCPITLTGVDPAVFSALLAEDTLNRRGIVYVAFLNSSNQIIGDPFIYFDGLMETPSVEYGQTSAVTINIKGRLAVWNRDKTQLLTDTEQRIQHPSDRGFEFINEIASAEIVWPAAKWFEVNK